MELHNPWIQLRFLTEGHREILRPLARDERIWEYTKTLLLTDTYDQQFDNYFAEALSFAAAGGQAYAIVDVVTGAVIGMTRRLAFEGSEHRIRVNSISPGLIVSGATRAHLDDAEGGAASEPPPAAPSAAHPDVLAGHAQSGQGR